MPCRQQVWPFPSGQHLGKTEDFGALMKIAAVDAIHLRIEDPNIGLFDAQKVPATKSG